MQGEHGGSANAVDSVLLWLSRDGGDLEWLLERMLAPQELLAALREQGAPRRPGSTAAHAVAALLPQNERLRSRVAQRLLEAAPDGPAPALPAPAPNGVPAPGLETIALAPDDWRRVLRDALASGSEDGAEAIRSARSRAGDGFAPRADAPRDPARRAKPEGAPARRAAEAAPAPEAVAERLRQELAQLQRELAREHTRRRELAEELDRARAELRSESQRASEFKKRLAAAKDPGARERELQELADRAAHEIAVLRQKFGFLEEERDDLRACLEDYDRFLALPAEEVPSFHNRPLLPEEVELKRALESRGRAFRVLVVGGGEPQHRHTDKLTEYAAAVGFAAEWRMAEYVSWHREIDKLAADMKTRFDALVILHYNRTTFTRHARAICDDAGHKPCITCRYEGFTSLRASLRECLRQLVAAGG